MALPCLPLVHPPARPPPAATPAAGCESINLQILPGYPDVPGAHFLVNISMNSSAGLLLPSGESAVPALFLGKGVDVMDLLVTVTTKQGVAYFNATQVGLLQRAWRGF